jgi:integrase/recombinase XerD
MHLLQAGIDVTVIALWLGHVNPATTHGYIEAALALKERVLVAVTPPHLRKTRYRPSAGLLHCKRTAAPPMI